MQVVHKRIPVVIWLYKGMESTSNYTIDADYEQIPAKATVQIMSQQELSNKYEISLSGNVKVFYFDANIISGLNRNIEKGADWIQMRGLTYQVVFTRYEALDDFICVIGREDIMHTGNNPIPENPPIESPANPDIFNG